MIDLFGLGKQQDPEEPPAAAEAPAPRGSHKLWAFLLVLDALFVIVFAGAVAAKVYQHWEAPADAPAPAARRRPVKAAPPAPVPAPVPAPAPAPEPLKAPEPPKPAVDAPRPPKPSMFAEAPKHRGTPRPADAGGRPAPAAPPAPPSLPADGKVKALRTEFRLHAPKAKTVELIGAFIVRGGRKEMARQDDGTWTLTLYLNPGSYRYFFSVDKRKQLDPENPRAEKGASLLTLP
ncbi:MAG: hypothetical protein HY403_05845 [Elusimicrobia bacterium]|nr:hypothetical protein [Elusimicrobiota bacterium]